jgi:hypothetical protein
MALNKLDNFIKNTEGRILYVNPNDLDATDAITNQGNSLAQPFKTVQRALLEAARFSYLQGSNNDVTEKTTILLFPGIHTIDNRPGFALKNSGTTPYVVSPSGTETIASETLSLTLSSNFDITQLDNILYKFNSINGGVIVPRGTSIVGLDLRKTKLRPKYVPNPTDSTPTSAIFRITGACYFWQFSFFDADESGKVYTNKSDFSEINKATPTFSHHKLTCFEYVDGVNIPPGYDITDLDMYYGKVSNAFRTASGRDIDQKYPVNSLGFSKQRPEWEIVGAFATDPISIGKIISGDGIAASTIVTVTTSTPHNLTAGTPIKINKVDITYYNISTKVQNVLSSTQFTYLIPENYPINLDASPTASNGTVTIETDTVGGASPYIFNISLRSVWGMNGMHADGSKAAGFKSMVVAQFTGVSLQKDDRAFVKYNPTSRDYKGIIYSAAYGADLTSGSTSTDINSAYHLDSGAVYRNGWETFHIKMSNDAFIQIVSVFAIGYTSHFKGESGADASITNSNSNFGQNSLAATGFKKEAFAKDNTAYITSIIAPRAITSPETDIDWISLDVGITTQVGISSHLYLYGFSASDDIPPNILQGYRVGAKNNEILYANIGSGTSTASIYMCDKITSGIATGTNSSEKSYSVTGSPTNNSFTIGNHALLSGEKIRILSTSGDLPENITENTVYYAITSAVDGTLSPDKIKLATSSTNAALASAINVYLGTDLKIVSRVSDKNPGDIGSPIQYDNTIKNWFVHTNTNSEIYRAIDTAGTSVLGARTNVSYIKRTSDSRSIDEKIYKLRVVVPKESVNSRDPLEGFVIQESSSTGIGSDAYATTPTISASDLNYNKNPRFISTCSTVGTTITVISELPHNLNANDIIIVKNVTDNTATTTGADNIGYNGTFSVTSIVNDKTFTYSTTDVLGVVHSAGTFTNNTSSRTTSLPRFQRNDLQSNYYIYRSEIISQYKSGVSDGIYYLYALNAKNAVPTEFTSSKYNQNVVNLYPQLDRDNINENPIPTKTFAKRAPLGDVGTSDIKGSLTRETVDSFLQDFGLGLDVDSVTDAGTSATITFKREHGLSGIVTYSTLTGGSAKTPGTYYNVKLLNTDLTTWNGATAKVIVSSGQVTSATIQSKGSGYGSTTLYFDTTKIGGTADATITVATSGITTNIGDVIQFTGSATTSTSYYRITSVPSPTSISIAKTAGDPVITTSQYGFVVAPSTKINSSVYYPTTGITSFTCAGPHGLLAGNRFNLIDSNNNNLGDYLVATKVGINTFNAITNNSTISGSYVLKHGMSSNEAVADVTGENIGVRDFSFYDNDILKLVAFDSSNDTLIQVSSPISGISTSQRFPLGSYIQVDGEIMRVVSSTLNGYDQISVIRGVLGTIKASHDPGSIIKKIKPIPIELRRPTILRASNQTFEYLGYGPGNYSTGLPQVQVRTITEKEAYLAQSQQKSCGTVVYTGMNNDGDFYIGNKKLSSKTGQEVVFDAPIPTITGQDASRLSVVYDEVTIKERVLVEGGNSGTILSQFDGPVTFNKETKFNATVTNTAQLKVINTTQSTDTLNGAVIVSGGVGIAKNLNIGGTLAVTDDTTFNKNVTLVGSNSVATEYFKIQNASAADKFTVDSSSGNTNISGILSVTGTINATTPNPAGTSGGVRIAANSSNNSYLQFVSSDRNTEYGLIVGTASSVTIQSSNGSLVALNDNTEIYGTLNVTGDITAFFTSDQRLKENIVPIVNPLAKVLSISGNTFDWVQGAGKEGSDVGVLAQEVLKVLPEAVTTRETGYLAVRYEKIIPLLIEAIKDLSAKVEDLQDQINNK